MMSGLRKFFGGLFRGAATTIDPVNPKDPALARMFGLGAGTFSGVDVTHDKVMAIPAVLRAVSIISNGMAKLPFYVFREQEDGHTWDKTHPSWTAVSRKPHRDVTDGKFRESLTAWAMLYGNAHAYIDAPNWPYGPVQLIPLLPDRTWPYRVGSDGSLTHDVETEGMLRYATRVRGETRTMDASQVFHLKGLGPNPYIGYNIFELLSESFGGSIALQEFGHRYFGQGANPAGFIKMAGRLDDEEAEERFVKSMAKAMSGLGKSHKIALLEDGADFTPLTINPHDSQAVESRTFDVRTIAMTIGIKPHKLIDGANSAFASLEQANQEHKDDDLMPWVCRWREEFEDKMLTEEQKVSGSHSIDVDDEALSWVPFTDRVNGTVKMYHGGLIDKDEGRLKLNYGPSKVDRAKDFKTPANIVFEGDQSLALEASLQPSEPPPVEDEPDDTQTDDTTPDSTAFVDVSLAYMDKIAARLCKAAQTKSRNAADFDKWLNGLTTESGPIPLQPSIDQLYAYVATESKNCLLSTVTDAELTEKVAASSITFTEHAASITVENLTCTPITS